MQSLRFFAVPTLAVAGLWLASCEHMPVGTNRSPDPAKGGLWGYVQHGPETYQKRQDDRKRSLAREKAAQEKAEAEKASLESQRRNLVSRLNSLETRARRLQQRAVGTTQSARTNQLLSEIRSQQDELVGLSVVDSSGLRQRGNRVSNLESRIAALSRELD